MSNLYPISFNRSLTWIFIMAFMTTSAALPWMGVLIAARSAWPRAPRLRDAMSGKWRYRPISVRVKSVLCARAIVCACHSRTSGRSAYLRRAKGVEQPRSAWRG